MEEGRMLLVNSIFTSISGEVGAIPQGTPVTFIRLQGCNMQPPCPYCDTIDSQDRDSGYQMSIDEVISHVKTKNVILTGGEPLMQWDWSPLTIQLARLERRVQIETNGTWAPDVTMPVNYVMDQKMFLSKTKRRANEFAVCLNPDDWIKYVVEDKDQLDTAIFEMKDISYYALCQLAVSVVNDGGNPLIPYSYVINKFIDNGLDNVVVNFQIHKLVDLP